MTEYDFNSPPYLVITRNDGSKIKFYQSSVNSYKFKGFTENPPFTMMKPLNFNKMIHSVKGKY
jgi:hypothetical protein